MKSSERVSKAQFVASTAFLGEEDKSGNAAVLHSMRVGLAGKTDSEQIIGFLHDVVEDFGDEFEQDIVAEVCQLTEDEAHALMLLIHSKTRHTYDEYIQRIANSGNLIAINVKLNDLEDNMTRPGATLHPKRSQYIVAEMDLRDARRRITDARKQLGCN